VRHGHVALYAFADTKQDKIAIVEAEEKFLLLLK
jgi:hypothetical protein